MLKLYHAPISPNSRRVWVTLLEKQLEFELVEMTLNGDQFQPEYLALNPFHHIPVLIDDGFKLIESLAILDYLEAKYPTPAMLPTDAKDLAIVRMVQMITINELQPALTMLSPIVLGFPGGDPEKIAEAKQKAATVFTFFESLLGDRPFFGSQNITLAEAVAGTVVPWLLGGRVFANDDYPQLSAWCDRLLARPAWQTTDVRPETVEALKSRMIAKMARMQ